MQTNRTSTTPVAIVTGASRGLGFALVERLTADGWHVVIDARRGDDLRRAAQALPPGRATAIAGDVADDRHRAALAAAAEGLGRLDLLVNNASTLGPSPQPRLADHAIRDLERVVAVNALAPLALAQLVIPHLERAGGTIVNVSSDAGAQAYPGWGGYGASKAALDQITAVLAVEHPCLRVFAFDPGDMLTEMHQQAYPGEDISDRPSPESVVAALMRLVDGDLVSGRHRAADLVVGVTV